MKKYFFYLVLFLSLSCNKDEDNVVPLENLKAMKNYMI